MGLLDATGGLEQRVNDCDHDGEGGGGGWGGKRTGADLRAAFEASCLRGALPPVDLRAVCYTQSAIITTKNAQKQQMQQIPLYEP
jgi:hypothetical protein